MKGKSSRRSERAQQALDALDLTGHPDREALLGQVHGLGEKRRNRILRAALRRHLEEEARHPFAAELRKLQRHITSTRGKVIVLFEGRDAAGKGGAIHHLSSYLDPERHRIVALDKPTPKEQDDAFMDRYLAHLPTPGEIVLFDRSWYNRAMVEPVMGFCTPAQYESFMAHVNTDEERIVADGTRLLKLFFSVSRPVQSKRFERRGKDAWRLSEVDRQAQTQWHAYTEKEEALLRRTHTAQNPWWVIRSDNRKLARIETLKLLLRQLPYPNPSPTLDFSPHPQLTLPGDVASQHLRDARKAAP